jgi:hypothetical protein
MGGGGMCKASSPLCAFDEPRSTAQRTTSAGVRSTASPAFSGCGFWVLHSSTEPEAVLLSEAHQINQKGMSCRGLGPVGADIEVARERESDAIRANIGNTDFRKFRDKRGIARNSLFK